MRADILIDAMECTARIIDESPDGKVLQELTLTLLKSVTAADIIRSRVKREVEEYNAESAKGRRMLVQPGTKEAELNGPKRAKKAAVDGEEQIRIALRAFKENRFFILVDDRQVEDLEEKILLGNNAKIAFVRLVPLVGG